MGSAVTPVPDLGRAIEERFGSFQQRLAEADRATEERFGGFQQRLRRLELTEKNNQEQLIQPLIERVAALETAKRTSVVAPGPAEAGVARVVAGVVVVG